jgi:ClpP class serine protease
MAGPEGMKAGWVEDALAQLPPMWQHAGSTAVIDISGPVVQGDAGIMRLFGVLGYDNIAQAVSEAAAHPDTKKMMYHINSPGGDVNGIIEMGQHLADTSAKVPSAVHTSNQMASAGYWMASSIKGPISSGPVATVGSIGVLLVHTEKSKALADQGVKVTVLRAGEHFAALLDDYEENLETGEIDLRDIEAARQGQAVTLRGLVRALNALLERFGVRERMVPLRSDADREVYVALPLTEALELARLGHLEEDSAEDVMELGCW